MTAPPCAALEQIQERHGCLESPVLACVTRPANRDQIARGVSLAGFSKVSDREQVVNVTRGSYLTPLADAARTIHCCPPRAIPPAIVWVVVASGPPRRRLADDKFRLPFPHASRSAERAFRVEVAGVSPECLPAPGARPLDLIPRPSHRTLAFLPTLNRAVHAPVSSDTSALAAWLPAASGLLLSQVAGMRAEPLPDQAQRNIERGGAPLTDFVRAVLRFCPWLARQSSPVRSGRSYLAALGRAVPPSTAEMRRSAKFTGAEFLRYGHAQIIPSIDQDAHALEIARRRLVDDAGMFADVVE